MDKKHPDSKPLAAPEEALGFYLDSLLMEVPPESPVEEPALAPVTTEAAAEELGQGTKIPTENKAAKTADSRDEKALPITESSEITSRPAKSTETPTGTTRAKTFSSASISPSVVPLTVERRELGSRPFAEPPRPQALLSAPPIMPLLMQDEATPVASSPVDVEPASAAKPALVDVSADVQKKPVPTVVPAATDKTEKPVADTAEAVTEPAAEEPPHAPPPPSVVPEWAETPFQCLSFTVAGLTLAAPLERLHGIIEWHGEITALPGYAPWFMGLQPNRGQNVRVIDTAQIIMPDGRRPDTRPAVERVTHVVLMDDGRWGLAVDAIAQILTLSADGVRWRGVRSKRPWLAGTAVEQMCAVLDIDSLSAQLRQGLKLDDE